MDFARALGGVVADSIFVYICRRVIGILDIELYLSPFPTHTTPDGHQRAWVYSTMVYGIYAAHPTAIIREYPQRGTPRLYTI